MREGTRDLLRATAAVLAVTAALSGWHYVRHRVLYGQFVLTAYNPFVHTDLDLQDALPRPADVRFRRLLGHDDIQVAVLAHGQPPLRALLAA